MHHPHGWHSHHRTLSTTRGTCGWKVLREKAQPSLSLCPSSEKASMTASLPWPRRYGDSAPDTISAVPIQADAAHHPIQTT